MGVLLVTGDGLKDKRRSDENEGKFTLWTLVVVSSHCT